MWYCTLNDIILTMSIWLYCSRRGGSVLQVLNLSLPSLRILYFRFSTRILFECTLQDRLAVLPTAANLCANFGVITVSKPAMQREAEERNPELLIPNTTKDPQTTCSLKSLFSLDLNRRNVKEFMLKKCSLTTHSHLKKYFQYWPYFI